MSTLGSSPPENDFYDAAALEPHLIYQGEILIDVPILIMPMPSRWLLLRTRSGKMVDEALQYGSISGPVKVLDSNQSKEQWHNATEGDFAMARLTKRPVLVLSQTCDVQTKDFIQVAPIFDAAPDDVATLESGELYGSFYLRAHPPQFNVSYADLIRMQAVHKSYIKRVIQNQHFRLTEDRTRSLQRFITRYFGRPNSFDAESDKVPRRGRYLCVSCFYMNGVVTGVERNEGDDFPLCSRCGGRGWVLQGRPTPKKGVFTNALLWLGSLCGKRS